MSKKTIERELKVTFLPVGELLIIKKQSLADTFFYSNDRTIAISVSALYYLISFLLRKGWIKAEMLEKIIADYENSKTEEENGINI